MARNRDFIPRNDAEFDTWFRNLLSYVVEKTNGTPPEWDHIPQRHIAELNAAYEDSYDIVKRNFHFSP